MPVTLHDGSELPLGREAMLDHDVLDLVENDGHLPLRFLRQALHRIERVREEGKLALVTVQVLTPDVAVSTFQASYSLLDTAGATTFTVPFAWTAVWNKENDDWKWVNSHRSFEAAAAASPPSSLP
jgi:hypothetical protein